jgi:hypothetical protein
MITSPGKSELMLATTVLAITIIAHEFDRMFGTRGARKRVIC